jgi:adenylate cyclase
MPSSGMGHEPPARRPATSPDSPASGFPSDDTARLSELILGDVGRYDQTQVARLAGVSLEQAQDLWRCLGFANPDVTEVMYTDSDVAALQIAAGLHQADMTAPLAIPLELPSARALGQSMNRMTDWQADLLDRIARSELIPAEEASRPVLDDVDGRGEPALPAAELRRQIERTVESLMPVWERLQQHVWRRHLLAATERALTHGRTGPTRPVVVGFADIADFTSTSRGLTDERLADYIETFESTASLTVTDHGGRVIKTIGDEIMFVVEDPAAAAEIALTLARRPSDLDGRAELHVGLAHGPVLRKLGDLYGTVVNLANRLTALARPGSVLVDTAMAHALAGAPELRLHELRPVNLRGFEHLRPWLLRADLRP